MALSLDLTFAYDEVKGCYGYNGNVSLPPPLVLKLMLLLVLYNVRSERELMETLPERLDWLWFLGLDLDSEIPDHSVLSKARKRWGVAVFRALFERVVWQCVETGLVDGRKMFVDASFVDADASNNSVVDRKSLRWQLSKSYVELEARLEERDEKEEEGGHDGDVNERYISTTDPDASVVRQRGGKANLRYKSHRVVDGSHRVITATELTTGAVNRPNLVEVFSIEGARAQRDKKITMAHMEYGYTLKEIADYLKIHYTTVSKVVRKGLVSEK